MGKLKEITILHKSLGIGGVERSLLNFIKNFKDDYKIKLVLLTEEEKTISGFDFQYEIFDSKYNEKLHKVQWLIDTPSCKLNFFNKISQFIIKVLLKFKINPLKFVKLHRGKYHSDIGICFAPWNYSLDVYKKYFKCKKNICIVHGDVSKVSICNNPKKQLKQFDKILCVSDSCKQAFEKTYPTLKDKADYLYNFSNNEEIAEKSKEDSKFNKVKDRINLISVSRLSEEKGFLRSLKILKSLIDNGQDNFCWHILGDGPDKSKIEEFVKNNKMQDHVILYGNQPNPYPYIKQADLFYLGSYHEAAPMVYAEAMTLRVPVLTTNTASANELVGNKGFVCENTEEDIFKQLSNLLANPKEIEKKKKELNNYCYDNQKIKERFISIVNE